VWVKACVVKWWFAGAVFYFVGWGLFIQTRDQLELTLALGLAHGLATDILANRALKFFETDKESYRGFIFCYARSILSMPVNLLSGVVLATATSYFYHYVNLAAVTVTGSPPGTVFLGAEPILYGLFFMGFDMLCIFVKNKTKGLVKWNSR
jgi:hypothetical protein